MKNIIEYKDWLFVHVSLNLINVVRVEGNKVCYGAKRAGIFWRPLPPGSWQIIGKGDVIDWEGIAEKSAHGINLYVNYSRAHYPFTTATESGHSLLRSLEMEPGTTLVLKRKN